jgi:hypothetical protein
MHPRCLKCCIVGSAALVIALILFLKLTSYALVNRDLREMYLYDNGEAQAGVKYPNNISVFNILYFWWAPTLCYQPSYPRSPKFRATFFLKRVSELVVCLVTMYLLAEQYAKPTLENSLKALEDSNYIVIVERVLKLSTTAVVIWLLMFYALFHAFLNALSEVSIWYMEQVKSIWSIVLIFFQYRSYVSVIVPSTSPGGIATTWELIGACGTGLYIYFSRDMSTCK